MKIFVQLDRSRVRVGSGLPVGYNFNYNCNSYDDQFETTDKYEIDAERISFGGPSHVLPPFRVEIIKKERVLQRALCGARLCNEPNGEQYHGQTMDVVIIVVCIVLQEPDISEKHKPTDCN